MFKIIRHRHKKKKQKHKQRTGHCQKRIQQI